MIFIWGTKVRTESLGTVADWCQACRRVRAFEVTNYYRVGHIYYISLGSGSLHATVRECWRCFSQFYCNEEDYDRFYDEADAEQMSIGKLLERTNTLLLEELERQRQREEQRERQERESMGDRDRYDRDMDY